MSGAAESHPLPGGILEVRTHARKGRSLYTSRLVKGGELVLAEAPLLLLVAPDMAHTTCATCLRTASPQACLPCEGCRQAVFCSEACRQAAHSTPWLHSPPICSAYARLSRLPLGPEPAGQLRFLLHALALAHAGTQDAADRFAALLRLTGEAGPAELALAAQHAPFLAEALADAPGGPPPLDPAQLATLLRKEQLNSYGVLAAPSQLRRPGAGGAAASLAAAAEAAGGEGPAEEDGERRLRGSALYAQASLINHECLPNVARFDAFDSAPPPPPGGGAAAAAAAASPHPHAASAAALPAASPYPPNTHVCFRALHDLPAGTELAASYVPLHWRLAERQAQCREVYGFDCTCPRCQTESQWSDAEESEWETDSGGGGEGGGDAMAEGDDGDGDDGDGDGAAGAAEDDAEVDMKEVIGPITAPPGEEGPLEPAYLRLFLLKYMCAVPGCFGTAAPPTRGSPLLECNVCGATRSEQDFLRELERAQREGH